MLNIFHKFLGRRTVANDLILWLNITILTTILAVGIFFYNYTTRNNLAILSHRAEVTEQEIVQVLSPQLFFIDNNAIQHTAGIFLASHRLSGIRVISDVDGVVVDKPSTAVSLLPLKESAIVYNNTHLGKVQLWFDDGMIRDAQRQTILMISMVLLVSLVVNIITVLFIVRAVLTKPLLLLKTRIEELASGSYEVRVPTVPQYNLNSIMLAVNNMATKLASRTEQLAESEEKYRKIFNATGDAIFMHDADTGKILDVNTGMLEMFGYTYEEALQVDLANLSSGEHPYTKEEAGLQVENTVLHGPRTFKWLSREKDGSLFWTEVALKYAEFSGSRYVIAVVRDIRERVKAEKQLVEEKQFSDAVINSLPGIFFVYRGKDKLVRWNKNHEISTGYSGEELSRMQPLDWFEKELHHKVTKSIEQVYEEGAVSVELPLKMKDGSNVPYLLQASSLVVDGEHYLLGIGLDISARILAEEENQKMAQQLIQAQKMESIGTLAGGIAHDFNNILSAIFGYSDLAELDINNKEALLRDLNEVKAGAHRAQKLVQQILTFSRRKEEQQQPLQISLVVREALKLLRASIPTTISIHTDIPSEGVVIADPTQIHQVIMNLCTNAYHAMRESGGTLGVVLKDIDYSGVNCDSEVELAKGKYVYLEVSDDGIGMDSSTKEKVFDPYFTTKDLGEGTGLGLAVVHGIVKSYGGTISIESDLGQGTTFKIFFPIAEGVTASNAREREDELSLIGGDETILLVDDEPPIINVMTKFLSLSGYKVISFTNGVQALQEFQKIPHDYDLLITDMTMPYMTGMQLAQKVKDTRPNMPIILSTGHSTQTNREKCLAMGINEYFEKPLDIANLLRMVRKLLDTAKISGSRILFIDDMQCNVELGKELFRLLGCKVIGTTDPDEALSLYAKEPNNFDAIFTDQNMPDMTGIELAKRVLDIRPGIPIFLVTGDKDKLDEEQVKSNGIQKVIGKPLNGGDLMEAVASIVGNTA